MRMDRRGEVGGGGDIGGVGDLAGCANGLDGRRVSLVSDIGVCSLTGEKIG